MSEPEAPRHASAVTAARVSAVVLWSAFLLCQAVSQAVHHWPPSWWWGAARLLLAVSLALGGVIIVQRRFSRSTLVLVVLGTPLGQFQTLRWLSALLVWRYRDFAP